MKSNALKTTALVVGVLLFLAATTFLTIKFIHHAHLASSPDIAGAWEGTVSMQGMKQRVVLNIAGMKGAYTGTVDHIDMGMRALPIDKLDYDYPNFRFELSGGAYEAKINPAATEMHGHFKQAKTSIPVTLKRTTTPDTIPTALTENDYAPRNGSDIQGLWKGTLNIGPMQLRLNFKVAEANDGTMRVEMDSPDQGVTGMPATAASYQRPAVKFEYAGINGSYQGDVGGGKITGTWKQMGRDFPLTLELASAPEPSGQDLGKTFAHTSQSELQGHWKGVLNVQKTKLHLDLDIAKMSDGTFSGSMTSPDQSPVVVPATTLEYAAPQLSVEWKGIGGKFVGDLKSGKLSGNWYQGGVTFPVVFERK